MPSYHWAAVTWLVLTQAVFSQDDRVARLLDFTSPTVPSLPDAEGFAGMYAGSSGGALIAAGGANFPAGRPWEGGTKVWYDQIFVLEPCAEQWRLATERLPHRLAYGVSVTYKDRVICIGGSDGERHRNDVFSLAYRAGNVEIAELPPLPEPLAEMSGALVDSVMYVLGGITGPDATTARHACWALDLESLDLETPSVAAAWRAIEPWPGPARLQATCAAFDGQLYLIGGVQVRADEQGRPQRIAPYLRDAYSFTPEGRGPAGQWRRLADVPRATAAAPSPAPVLPEGMVLVLGGVDGSQVHVPAQEQTGFDPTLLVYNVSIDQWAELPHALPDGSPRVTAPVTRWDGGWVVVSGEKSPGRRSPDVHGLRSAPPAFGALNWSVLCGYLAIMVLIGWYCSSGERTTDDFFLAGGRIPWWAAGLSIFGTQLSAITFMTIPAIAYAEDWRRITGSFMIFLITPIIIVAYLPFFRRLNVATAYEYLEQRFHLSVRLLGSATFIIFQVARMGIVLYLPAIALSAVTGINVYLCIGVMGVIATLYTVMGGIEAVIWTDVVQVLVLLGGALLCLLVTMASGDGWNEFLTVGRDADKFTIFAPGGDWSQMNWWVIGIGFFFMNLTSYTTDQAVVQRYMTTSDQRAAARGLWLNGVMAVPATLLFYSLGTALYVFYQGRPELATPMKNDQIVPWFVVHHLPPGVAGLVIAGIFAAAMSSLDSSMNSVATAYVTDFHRRLRPSVSDKAALRIAKWLTLVLGAVGTVAAMGMASVDIYSLFDHFQIMLGMIGGGLCGVFALGIFTRRTNWIGALAGLVIGTATPLVLQQTTEMNPYLYCAAGFITCYVVGLLVSVVVPLGPRDLSGLTLFTRSDYQRVGPLRPLEPDAARLP